MDNIRNFCIIAHIDHGKSTLADRFLELTGTVEKRKMREQFLDMHPLERERGITIKMQPVRMRYTVEGQEYTLNLIDTPGHVDFSYEVSRALAAVEGAILLVDATQGIQAQTLANLHLARSQGLVIIPVINKINLPSAEVEKTEKELAALLEVSSEQVFKISAKTGEGVEKLLRAVIEKIPSPQETATYRNFDISDRPLRALIFDSSYDAYQGVIAHIRIFDGAFRKGEKIFFMAVQAKAEALEVGVFSPHRIARDTLSQGEIGYVATGIKEPEKVKVGDTITRPIDISKEQVEPLSGYQEPVPVVFASIFPENQDEYEMLREALKKLKLNDAAFTFEPEESGALGRGIRAGFLGMLHMEIVSERLRREYGQRLIFSNPSVAFKVKLRAGQEKFIYSAVKLPAPQEIEYIEEPWAVVEITTPPPFLGSLTSLLSERGGKIIETANLGSVRLIVRAELALRELLSDFYDQLKSVSQGFASLSYKLGDYRRGDFLKLDILVAGEKVPALSEIVPREKVYFLGRERVLKLKELIPKQLFSVALQAETEGRIIARETIPARRKDVTGYLYGGDRSRKMKLWKKQQKGKKKLRERGRVEIPPEVFLKLLKK